MPTLLITDVRCPKCNGLTYRRSEQKSNNVFFCQHCQVVWQIVDGRLVPAIEALRLEWERELTEREL